MEGSYTGRMRSFDGNLWDLQSARSRTDLKTDRYVLSGLMSKFCLAFDLSWKCMKDVITGYHGVSDFATGSSRETLEKAFELGIVDDEEMWPEIMRIRSRLSHDYNSELAYGMVDSILERYLAVFESLQDRLHHYNMKGRSHDV